MFAGVAFVALLFAGVTALPNDESDVDGDGDGRDANDNDLAYLDVTRAHNERYSSPLYQFRIEFFGTLISQHHAGPELFEALNEIRFGCRDSHNHRSFFHFIYWCACI